MPGGRGGGYTVEQFLDEMLIYASKLMDFFGCMRRICERAVMRETGWGRAWICRRIYAV